MEKEKRLIVDALKKYHDAQFTPGVYEHSIFGKAAMLLETDAVEVVRCKDCFADGCCSVQIDLEMGGDGYCSKGKRRTDNA